MYIYINTRTIEPNSPSKWNFTRFMYHGAGMFFRKQKVDTILSACKNISPYSLIFQTHITFILEYELVTSLLCRNIT